MREGTERKEEEKGERKKEAGQSGEGKNVGVRVGGCQAWCQVTGALGASRIFTNEGSKKEKRAG